LYVLDRFDVLMSKIIFKTWKNIIGMHFDTKNYLKSTRNHTVKHPLSKVNCGVLGWTDKWVIENQLVFNGGLTLKILLWMAWYDAKSFFFDNRGFLDRCLVVFSSSFTRLYFFVSFSYDTKLELIFFPSKLAIKIFIYFFSWMWVFGPTCVYLD
jgi:hypothetical protein